MRRRASWLLLLAASLALVFKSWKQILSGRLWAEEASVYLQQAIASDAPIATFFEPALGYYSLINRLCAAILSVLPVDCVGHASLALALAFLLLLWIVMSARSGHHRSPWLLAAFAPVSLLLANGELLSNTLLLSYWYGAGAAILVFSEPHAGRQWSWPAGVVLMLSALSGPHAIFILFACAVYKWWNGNLKGWLRRADVVVFAAFTAVQVAYVSYSLLTGGHHTGASQGGERFGDWTFLAAATSITKYNVLYPFTGYTLVSMPTALQFAVAGSLVILIGRFLYFADPQSRRWLVTLLVLQALYLIGSVGSTGAPRYAFVVNVLLVSALVNALMTAPHRSARSIALVLIACTTVSSLVDNQARIGRFADPSWPSFDDAIEHACRAAGTGVDVCIVCWPIGTVYWQLCIPPEEIADACSNR